MQNAQSEAGQVIHQISALESRKNCNFIVFTCFEAMSGQRTASVGAPGCMCWILFYARWGNVRPTNCCCGIAQVHVLYSVSHAKELLRNCFCGVAQIHASSSFLYTMRQYQANQLLQWDRPDAYFILCFTRIEAISSEGIASVGAPRCAFWIVLYTHWGEISG